MAAWLVSVPRAFACLSAKGQNGRTRRTVVSSNKRVALAFHISRTAFHPVRGTKSPGRTAWAQPLLASVVDVE